MEGAEHIAAPVDHGQSDQVVLPELVFPERAELEVVERLGAESHLIFAVDAQKPAGEIAAAADEATEEGDATLLAADNRARFTARVEGRRRFTPGEAVEFTVPPDALHVFDAATGEAVR